MSPSITIVAASISSLPFKTKKRGRGNKVMVGKVAKANVGVMQKEIREGFSRRLRKEMTGMVK